MLMQLAEHVNVKTEKAVNLDKIDVPVVLMDRSGFLN